MKYFEQQVVKSTDGSSTIFLPQMNETYHSLHGAYTESEHVFINAGLNKVLVEKPIITILEVGMGTGLNVMLTYNQVVHSKKLIFYHSLEPYPLEANIVSQLNYLQFMKGNYDRNEKAWNKIHSGNWEEEISLSFTMNFFKHKNKLEEFTPNFTADLIYFDAFAPNKQPEVWYYENLKKLYNALSKNGILVSYCAQGQFKRDLKKAGFEVESLPGPPGKKEMTRAVKL